MNAKQRYKMMCHHDRASVSLAFKFGQQNDHFAKMANLAKQNPRLRQATRARENWRREQQGDPIVYPVGRAIYPESPEQLRLLLTLYYAMPEVCGMRLQTDYNSNACFRPGEGCPAAGHLVRATDGQCRHHAGPIQ